MLDLEKIDQILKTADEHLRKLESQAGLIREVVSALNEIRHAQEKNYLYELQRLRLDFAEVVDQLKKRGLSQSDKYEKELQEIRTILDTHEWPIAVDHSCICDDEGKAVLRADSILDLLVGEHMKDKRFLDYGCGKGHVVMRAKTRDTRLSFGYDVDLSQCTFPREFFASHFEKVREQAPFDIVLLHDVLDHAVLMDPIQILMQVKSVLAPRGRVYVKNHPWSSRHGGHLYLQKNKAYLHLVLDSVELSRAGGLQCEPNVRVLKPLETYRHWFSQAGFHVASEIPILDQVEPFFTDPGIINNRLKAHFDNQATMINHLSVSFAEYILEPIGLNQQIL
jgi:SAM-dependent methyltransferase